MFDAICETLTSESGVVESSVRACRGQRKQRPRTEAAWLGQGQGETGDALHEAIEGGHRKIANDLVDSGASLAGKDKIAARRGDSEMVQLLLCCLRQKMKQLQKQPSAKAPRCSMSGPMVNRDGREAL